MDTGELIARESLRELVAAYAQLADGGRFDEVVALFADDGVLEVDDRPPMRGRDAIRAFLGGTGTHLRAATGVPLVRHHTSNLRLEVTSATEARGTCYFFVVTERGPDHWGRYRDTYRCVDGRWLFAHRRARLDGWTPTSWVGERRAATKESPR
jgi:ketosteroid isomerase-like protein